MSEKWTWGPYVLHSVWNERMRCATYRAVPRLSCSHFSCHACYFALVVPHLSCSHMSFHACHVHSCRFTLVVLGAGDVDGQLRRRPFLARVRRTPGARIMLSVARVMSSRLRADRSADVPTLHGILSRWMVERSSRDLLGLLEDLGDASWKTAPRVHQLANYSDLAGPLIGAATCVLEGHRPARMLPTPYQK